MGYFLIKNAKAVLDSGIFERNLLIKDNKIIDTSFSGKLPDGCEIYDADNNYVSAGFIDIHLHGGGGFDFMDSTEEAFKAISDVHLKNGSTTIIPTTVSADFESTLKMIECYKKYAQSCTNFYGVHLEGPYLSVAQKGAHNEKFLHAPTNEEIEQLLSIGSGVIKRITAAPELDNMECFARKMCDNGVHLSIGHSDATSDVALKWLKNGFSHITHMYCVTPTIRKIGQVVTAGIVEAAYLSNETTLELVADGMHVAKDAMKLAVKIKGIDKVCAVSDALRPAGTNDKQSYLGEKVPENLVIIEDGVAKLPDRTRFAGSVATGAMMLERLVNYFDFSILDAVKLLTSSPAKIMGMTDRGCIKNGLLADVVIFDTNLKINNVIKNGKILKN
ncbi:MAG: N-acetylglucosamine-6-phosphate deacetylase [Ruminococcaceae bacterium]|nr:N-acetylglucosamine-6-phosphate deacetylase [Oscillospiraceae bacterium]